MPDWSFDTDGPPGFLEPFSFKDEDGDTDPALKWASLPLAFAFAAFYILCFAVLNRPLNVLTARFPVPLSALVRILLPTVVGTLLCAGSWLLLRREGRLMAAACRRLFSLSLLCLVAAELLLWGDRTAQLLVLRFWAVQVLPPVLLCALTAAALFRRDWWQWYYEEDEDDEDEE